MFRILAVDDNEEVLRLIHHAATAAGHEVETANSGEQFKAAFVRLQPNVVIVDMRMPGIDGTEIVRWLSDAEMPPRVILMSGDPAGASSGLAGAPAANAGARHMAMLPKPFRIAELLAAIGRVQDQSDAD